MMAETPSPGPVDPTIRTLADSFWQQLHLHPFRCLSAVQIDDPKHFLTNILRKYRNSRPLFLYFEDQALEF